MPFWVVEVKEVLGALRKLEVFPIFYSLGDLEENVGYFILQEEY